VAGCCECGNESSGSGARELVSNNFVWPPIPTTGLIGHCVHHILDLSEIRPLFCSVLQ
jgi:hypothetical protein